MKHLISILKVVFCICLVLIGILIGKFISVPHFEVSKSLDLIDVFSVLVTILIAILLTVFFDKRKNDSRNEKDIILRRVDNVYEITSELQKESISGKIPYTEAASSIKRISTSMQSIYNAIEKCQFTIKNDIKESIKIAIGDLRDILTDTPKINKEEMENSVLSIKVKDGIIFFNRQRVIQIESKFDVLKDCLLELEIRINKK